VSLPAVYYHSENADEVIQAIQEKWKDAVIIFPDPNTETYLRNRSNIDVVVAIPFYYDDGKYDITFGVGNEIELALERKIMLYLFKGSRFYEITYKQDYLTREKTRDLEIAYIEERMK
jgi:hypothetical protein